MWSKIVWLDRIDFPLSNESGGSIYRAIKTIRNIIRHNICLPSPESNVQAYGSSKLDFTILMSLPFVLLNFQPKGYILLSVCMRKSH